MWLLLEKGQVSMFGVFLTRSDWSRINKPDVLFCIIPNDPGDHY
jgi:hypothetical protein